MVTAKRTSMAAALCAAIVLLGGCGLLEQKSVWEPQESDAISVASDGSITEIIQETLDQSYYDSAELQDMIASAVEEYNQEYGTDSVTMTSFTVDGQAVTLQLQYASAEDYAQFNNVEFYYGSMISAQLEGYLFDVSFYKISGGTVSGTAVDGSTVLKNMADQVIVVQAPMEVHVDGTVTFISTNADMISSDTVNATGEQEESEDDGLLLPSSAIYTGENAAAEEQSLVYIIYEAE